MSGPLLMRDLEKLAAKSYAKLPGRRNTLVMNWVAKEIDIPLTCPTTVHKGNWGRGGGWGWCQTGDAPPAQLS